MVYPGQIAYLECALPTSSSLVKIQWLKDEHPLEVDESRMTIMPSGKAKIRRMKFEYFCSNFFFLKIFNLCLTLRSVPKAWIKKISSISMLIGAKSAEKKISSISMKIGTQGFSRSFITCLHLKFQN